MTKRSVVRWAVLGGFFAALFGCSREAVPRRDGVPGAKDVAPAAPAPPAPQASAPTPRPQEPATVEQLRVPGDALAAVVRSEGGKAPVTVFLPGVCSNAAAYLMAFPEAARAQGGVVAIDGDAPCPGVPGFHTFSWDPERQHARIEAALAAAGLRAIPREGITIVGYSQGATIAEKLVNAHPERYGRAFVIAAPTDPSIPSFAKARAVVTGACSLDVTGRMKAARDRLNARHVPSTYVEMPGCTHGNVADGENVFATAFAFLREEALPTPAAATETPITGLVPRP